MTEPAPPDFTRYFGGEVLVDTNILLLYIVGLLDPKVIPQFKRTKIFTEEDFATLNYVLGKFRAVLTTPNILTEVSNLGGQLTEPLRSRFFTTLAHAISLFTEQHVASRRASQVDRFTICGLTDATILEAASQNILVITDDFRLAGFLGGRGAVVLNFNHLRSFDWQ